MDYKIIKILNEEAIGELKSLISNCKWVDGSVSFHGNHKDIKNNLEIDRRDKEYLNIRSFIFTELDKSSEFLSFTLPETTLNPIISKYAEGCYYKIHRDEVGPEYSTTIFLNDPSTYKGGELCLYINGKEETFKLPAGHAIIYKTGILHRVNKVTKGERLCAVLWSHSKAKPGFILDVYRDLIELQKAIYIKNSSNIKEATNLNSFESYIKDPDLLLKDLIEKIRHNLL
jgi:PKHD-type hydroxylase